MTANILVLIPIYNQPYHLSEQADFFTRRGFHVLFVNDGSDSATQTALTKASRGNRHVHIIALKTNRGKGAAVLSGLAWADRHGFTHALQVDADAQHDNTVTPAFVRACQSHPGAFILGYPIYDKTVPFVRRWGRGLTNFWVGINSLGAGIRDSMCGFRIYPCKLTLKIAQAWPRLGLRMEFDAEIAVIASWAGIPMINIPVNVTYPENGISHFRAIDNWRLSKMHTRCCLGMLTQLPSILKTRHQQKVLR